MPNKSVSHNLERIGFFLLPSLVSLRTCKRGEVKWKSKGYIKKNPLVQLRAQSGLENWRDAYPKIVTSIWQINIIKKISAFVTIFRTWTEGVHLNHLAIHDVLHLESPLTFHPWKDHLHTHLIRTIQPFMHIITGVTPLSLNFYRTQQEKDEVILSSQLY